jgi:hypothetical protein
MPLSSHFEIVIRLVWELHVDSLEETVDNNGDFLTSMLNMSCYINFLG